MIEEEKNFRWQFIQPEYLVKFVDGDTTDWYILTEPAETKNKSISMTVTCPHISTLLKAKNIYLTFDDENGIGTIQYIAEQILAGTGWSLGTVSRLTEADGETERVRSLKSTTNEGAYNLIQKLCTLFNVYPRYHGDTRKLDLIALNDRTTEWELVVGQNLESLGCKYDSKSVVTRLYVEGEYSDYGYAGIDDVNPTGLSYLLNFDYYKNLGLFTDEHQAILDQYILDAKARKEDISAAQASLNEVIDKVVYSVGYTPFTVYEIDQTGEYGTITARHRVLGATKDPEPGDDLVAIESDTNFVHIHQPLSARYPLGYQHIIFFERPCLGQIGVMETAIEAKEKQITGWERKLNVARESDVEKRTEYTNQINILRSEIADVYTNGLYEQMYKLAIDGISLDQWTQRVETEKNRLDVVEAKFLADMGDMIRDGRWTDENYTVGQEESLYEDA